MAGNQWLNKIEPALREECREELQKIQDILEESPCGERLRENVTQSLNYYLPYTADGMERAVRLALAAYLAAVDNAAA